MKSAIRFLAVLSIAALAPSIPVRSAFAAGPPDSTTIPKLLNQVRHHAAEANYDADILDSFRRSNMEWATYGQTLNHIKVHVNDLLQDYYQLRNWNSAGIPEAHGDAL